MELFIKQYFLNHDRETEKAFYFEMPNQEYGFYFPQKLVRKYTLQSSYKICMLIIPSGMNNFNMYKNDRTKLELNLAQFKMMLEDKKYEHAININDVKNIPKFLDNLEIDNKLISDLDD